MKKSKLSKYIILGAIAAVVATFILPKKEIRKGHPRDYAEIAADGTLHAATEYNSISFYVDGDTLSGFHYELIEAFARDHGLQVAITPEMSFNERLEGLANGRFDVIAYGILATSELKDSLLLTSPIVLNRQVLVQRKTDSPDDSLFIKSQLDLAGKTLNVVEGSPSILRIRNLGNEIGDTIYIKEVEKYGSEQLIALGRTWRYRLCRMRRKHRSRSSRQSAADRHKYGYQLHPILLMGSEQTVSCTLGQPECLAGKIQKRKRVPENI